MNKYEDRRKNEREYERQTALAYLKEWVAKIPPERMSKPEIGFGPKTFTAEQLVKEAEAGTEEGNRFLDMIYASKLEMLKRSG